MVTHPFPSNRKRPLRRQGGIESEVRGCISRVWTESLTCRRERSVSAIKGGIVNEIERGPERGSGPGARTEQP